MFKWFTMLVTAASLCLFSSPIQCSLPVQSHDCVLKKNREGSRRGGSLRAPEGTS